MSSSMSPVRSDLEEIVGKKAGGGGASPSPPSAAPRKASKSFVISSEERPGPAAQPNTATPAAAVEMKQVGYGSAAGGSVFKMGTFEESGTEYAKVTKPVVEYK